MKIKKVKLRGFRGIRRGLGVDEIEMDLSGLNGVVALTGPNGKGKTTFMECLQPYRSMPSRKLSLKDAVYLRDSQKDLIFTMGDEEMRSLVTVDASSGKSDGFLWANDDPLTTGKVSEHDEILEERLGSEDLFFHSVFSSQASESILSLRPAIRKQFFVEFLGLHRLQEYSESAKRVSSALGPSLGALNEGVRRLQEEIQAKDGLIEKKGDKEAFADEAQARVELHKATRQALNPELDRLRSEVQESIKAQNDLRVLYDTEKKSTAEMEANKKKIQDYLTECDSKIKTTAKELAELESKISTIEKLGNPAEIRVEIKIKEDEVEELGDMVEKLTAFWMAYRDAQEKAGPLKEEETEIKGKLDSTEKLKAAISQRPQAAPDDLCRQCGLLKTAWEALDSEGPLKTRLEEVQALIQEEEKRVGEKPKFANFVDGADITKRIKEIKNEIADLRSKLMDMSSLEGLKDAKQTKEIYLEELQNGKRGALGRLGEIETQIRDERFRIEAEIARLEALISKDLDELIRKKDEEAEALDSLIEAARKEASEAAAEASALGRQITELEAKEGLLGSMETKREATQKDQAEWALLGQLCGKDKLQALELDAAAPAITRLGNMLLGECFGGRFSMSFRTLDDEGREIFDLVVNDTLGDENEINVSILSGGEKLIVLHALRLALMLYMKERSGRDLQTVFADELDGALYTDSRREFVKINREAMRIGGIETFFLITHSEEVSEQADHIIHFENGGISVQ